VFSASGDWLNADLVGTDIEMLPEPITDSVLG
jgi:hypothetical protein